MTNPNPMTILVTGATGTVGRRVVTRLVEAGHIVRALVRDPGSANLPSGVESVRGDLANASTLTGTLEGIDAMFLVWPFTSIEAATVLAPTVVAMFAEHVPRIVYLSAETAAEEPNRFWGRVERLVERSSAEWTILRPTGFAKNTLAWVDQIRVADVVRWPYAAATRSLVHEDDIAAVAVATITQGGHHGRTYVVTGPEALTQSDQVNAIGQALGRTLQFEEISRDAARPGLVAAFGDESFADAALDAWAGFVTRPEQVTSTAQEITGRPARALRDWAADHADSFR